MGKYSKCCYNYDYCCTPTYKVYNNCCNNTTSLVVSSLSALPLGLTTNSVTNGMYTTLLLSGLGYSGVPYGYGTANVAGGAGSQTIIIQYTSNNYSGYNSQSSCCYNNGYSYGALTPYSGLGHLIGLPTIVFSQGTSTFTLNLATNQLSYTSTTSSVTSATWTTTLTMSTSYNRTNIYITALSLTSQTP
jgi:hypothetical protein